MDVKVRIWIINYVLEPMGAGTAVVAATIPDEAISLLKANGMYNGSPEKYHVEAVREVIDAEYKLCSSLIYEQNINENGQLTTWCSQ